LRQSNFLIAVAILSIAGSVAPGKSSKTAQPASKKTGSASKTTGTASRRKTGSTAASRTSAGDKPARQNVPTRERYMEIQQALADKGYFNGSIDGNWDADCIASLKRFQQDQNLEADGKLGSLSLIALGLGPKREPLQSQVLTKPESTQ